MLLRQTLAPEPRRFPVRALGTWYKVSFRQIVEDSPLEPVIADLLRQRTRKLKPTKAATLLAEVLEAYETDMLNPDCQRYGRTFAIVQSSGYGKRALAL